MKGKRKELMHTVLGEKKKNLLFCVFCLTVILIKKAFAEK